MKKRTTTVAIAIAFFGLSTFGKALTKENCSEISNSTGSTTTGSIKKFLRSTRTEDGLKRYAEDSGYSTDQLKKIRATLLGTGAIDLGGSDVPTDISQAEVLSVCTSLARWFRTTGHLTPENVAKSAEVIARNANIPVWKVLRFNEELTAYATSPDFVTGQVPSLSTVN